MVHLCDCDLQFRDSYGYQLPPTNFYFEFQYFFFIQKIQNKMIKKIYILP